MGEEGEERRSWEGRERWLKGRGGKGNGNSELWAFMGFWILNIQRAGLYICILDDQIEPSKVSPSRQRTPTLSSSLILPLTFLLNPVSNK